jgi:hypothetical protein
LASIFYNINIIMSDEGEHDERNSETERNEEDLNRKIDSY